MISTVSVRHGGIARRWFLPAVAGALIAIGGWQCSGTEAVPAGGDGAPSPIAFVDVTSEAGVGAFRHVTGASGGYWMPETLGGGGGFIDYDDDRRLDIVLVRGSQWPADDKAQDSVRVPALALFRNLGHGTFADRTAEAGLDSVFAYPFGITVADYDNDGDDDFFVTTLGRNLLFRNDGGVFEEVAEQAGVAGPEEWSTAAVFFDAGSDGELDLYVGNYVEWSPDTDVPCSLAGGVRSYCTPDTYPGLAGRFFENSGDGTFTERTDEMGFGGTVPGKTLAAASIDYNEDGWIDLFVVNDTERDLLYKNRGDGTFEEIGVVSGMAYDSNGRARAGMGVDVGVVDSTGRPTVFVTNFARERVGVYHYSGNGRFVDRAQQSNIGQASTNLLSFGVVVFDADLDGYLDVFTANGHINPEIEEVDGTVKYRQPLSVYRNRGNGTFEVIRGEIGGYVPNTPLVARGLAYGDYDGDGDVDLLIVENGGPAHLWRNETRNRNYLRIHLEGRDSNRSGIGARVHVVAGQQRAVQFVKSGSSYLSSSESVLTFALGSRSAADSLIVKWPSGHTDSFTNVSGNAELLVTEAEGFEVMGLDGSAVELSDKPQAEPVASDRGSLNG